MDQNIRSIFEEECRHLVIDLRLVKAISLYRTKFVTRNQDHQQFFGGHTLGVQTVRFLRSDEDRWFDEIMKTDKGPLEERLHALPTVHADWNVSSDVMNLSCVWLTHAIFNSRTLDEKTRHRGMIDVLLVLQYKFMTSRLYQHFKYAADPGVAEATYAQLSKKYAIKQYGSWQAVLEARSEEICSVSGEESIHYNTIKNMNDDLGVIYMLNDTQGRIRDMLKNIYGVFLQVHRDGIRITSSTSTIEHDGVEILKDRSKNLLAYQRYIKQVMSDRNSLIKQELVAVIEKIMHTMSPKLFIETLEWMSKNYQESHAQEIEEILSEALIFSFDYLEAEKSTLRNTADLPGLISTLRGVIMASRSSDPALFALREKTEKIVVSATGNKNESQVASVRTGILLYIVLRAITMKHYTNAA